MSAARRLLAYAARYRRSFLLGLTASICTTAIGLAGPWVLKNAIDDLSQGVTADRVRAYALAFVALAAAGGVFRILTRRNIIGASREIEYDLRNDIIAALQR
ncbi:MAG: ABC transporter transmembrane domain-containing protein, partial [Vicinamibacterales bacterium]